MPDRFHWDLLPTVHRIRITAVGRCRLHSGMTPMPQADLNSREYSLAEIAINASGRVRNRHIGRHRRQPTRRLSLRTSQCRVAASIVWIRSSAAARNPSSAAGRHQRTVRRDSETIHRPQIMFTLPPAGRSIRSTCPACGTAVSYVQRCVDDRASPSTLRVRKSSNRRVRRRTSRAGTGHQMPRETRQASFWWALPTLRHLSCSSTGR